jgi:CheY-like chemotaxis protein
MDNMGRSLHILLVEDDADSLLALSRLLEATGYRVCCAGTMTAALAAAGSVRFDLLIADIQLPDGTGLDLLRMLRDRDALPGIAMTGCDDGAAIRAAGFAAHITKPISFEKLIELIRQVTDDDLPTRLAS